MWILPKQLILAYALDTEALTLDSEECARICEQSLIRRSKSLPSKTCLREWKVGNWMRLRSGAISSHSLGQSFLEKWTSSLGVTHVNRFPQQESDSERKIRDTCGLGSQTEFGFSDQECASSKMSKDISRWDSPASSATWKSWVTRCRGEYSLRVKLAHLTNGSGSSSWPTSNARDWKDSITGTHPPSRPNLSEQTLGQAVSVAHGQAAPANPNTLGSRQGLWATPATRDTQGPRGKAAQERKGNPMDTLPNQLMTTGGKLNPRWVETLMGLPIGWTMPSCTRPVTIEPTNCDCLETESSQPPQNEHLELF